MPFAASVALLRSMNMSQPAQPATPVYGASAAEINPTSTPPQIVDVMPSDARPLTPPADLYSIAPPNPTISLAPQSSPPTTPKSRQSSSDFAVPSPPITLKRKTWAEAKPLFAPKVGFNTTVAWQRATASDNSGLAGILSRVGKMYKYTGISAYQTRLLLVKPGKLNDRINASLLVVSDSQLGTDELPYTALSYNWGDGNESATIYLQADPQSRSLKSIDEAQDAADVVNAVRAKQFKIKPNLYEALRHLRDRDDSIAIWVDALCINQFDPIEKEAHISKMAKIYREAYNVNIWLGSDNPERPISDTAMPFIQDVIDPEKHSVLLNESKYIKNWASLFELLRWSWFSRRWVIQELALAKSTTVHCGVHVCRWNDSQTTISTFRWLFPVLKPKLINYFVNSPPYQSTWYDDSVFGIKHLGASLLVDITSTLFDTNADSSVSSKIGLETLVCTLSGFATSDPRDTINCLRNIAMELNHPESQTAKEVPVPDYNQDLFEVYRDFVEWAIRSSHSLDILCRQWALKERLTTTPTTPRLVELPSWIQYAEDSPFGSGEDLFNGRREGDSFVGLPNKQNYHASGTGAAIKRPQCAFPRKTPSRSLTTKTHTASNSIPEVIYEMSLCVRGVTIGLVSSHTATFPDGVITHDCLRKLGWLSGGNTREIPEVPSKLWKTLVADRSHDGHPPEAFYAVACRHALRSVNPNGHLDIPNILRKRKAEQHDIVRAYLQRVLAATWNRLFFEGTPNLPGEPLGNPVDKLVGLGPRNTKLNDVIAVLFGCSVPVILRPMHSISGEVDAYQFVGEAYVDGKMGGEALHGDPIEMDFKLI